MNKDREIKIKIKKGQKNRKIKEISGPRMNDIQNKSSRWRKLPVKNIVKINAAGMQDNASKKKLVKYFLFLLPLLLIIVVILGFAYFKYTVVQSPDLKFIPAEASIYGNVQTAKLLSLPASKTTVALDGGMDFAGNYLINAVNNEIFQFGLDFSQDIKPYLGEKFSFAYIDESENSGFTFLIEVSDTNDIKNVLEKTKYQSELTQESYDEFEIFKLSSKKNSSQLYVSLIDNYIVASKKRPCVTSVIDSYLGKRLNLGQKDNFRKTAPWLIFNDIAYLYFEPSGNNFLFNQENNLSLVLAALSQRIDTIFAIIKDNGHGISLAANFTGEDFLGRENVGNDLVDLLPANTSGFMAGVNLSKDLEELKSNLAQSNPELEFYFSDILRKFEENTRTSDEELMNFFNNEFLISFDYTGDKVNYNLITKYTNHEESIAGMQIFEEAVANYFGNQYPRKQKMVLSDGSEADELIPDPESYRFDDIDFDGRVARIINHDNLSYDIAYLLQDNIVVISSSLGSLKNIIAAASENDKLVNKRYFNYPYSQAKHWGNNDIYYFDNKDLQDYFKFDNLLGKTLSLFDNITITTKASKNNLHLKSFLYIE